MVEKTQIRDKLRFRRPWWERDALAAAYARELMGTVRIVDIPAAVAAKFGRERAPSKSTVVRFMNVLRGKPAEKAKAQRRPRKARRSRRQGAKSQPIPP